MCVCLCFEWGGTNLTLLDVDVKFLSATLLLRRGGTAATLTEDCVAVAFAEACRSDACARTTCLSRKSFTL